jgi:hypothetical protein
MGQLVANSRCWCQSVRILPNCGIWCQSVRILPNCGIWCQIVNCGHDSANLVAIGANSAENSVNLVAIGANSPNLCHLWHSVPIGANSPNLCHLWQSAKFVNCGHDSVNSGPLGVNSGACGVAFGANSGAISGSWLPIHAVFADSGSRTVSTFPEFSGGNRNPQAVRAPATATGREGTLTAPTQPPITPTPTATPSASSPAANRDHRQADGPQPQRRNRCSNIPANFSESRGRSRGCRRRSSKVSQRWLRFSPIVTEFRQVPHSGLSL